MNSEEETNSPNVYGDQLILDNNGQEDEVKSQRVVFRVKADSGETLRKLLLMNEN